jgi:CheY-like chemotaxis protein
VPPLKRDKIRVVLAEDQAMVLGALAALLDMEDDIEVVARAPNGDEALRIVLQARPDVFITDIEMPTLTGLEVAAELKRRGVPVRVIILTTFARAGYLRRALDGFWTSTPAGKRERRLARVYRGLPSVSVDVGIMQPLTAARRPVQRVAVVPVQFGWNDVGSWIAMPDIWGHDRAGNAAVGKLLSVGTRNSIVYSPERLVALVGVTDLVVVDSADAVLICARGRAQDVRKVTDELERRGWSTYL